MKHLSLKMLKESGKRKLFVIPYFFTFANAFFGFLAVTKTLDYQFSAAAYCIMIAVFMDLLDGRLARAFHSSSYLGMELDSLSDAVSFCFAPAVLLYSWYFGGTGLLGIFVLTFYLCAGLFRLATFNSLSTKKHATTFFIGLPTTLAALIIAQIVVHYRWIIASPLRFLLHPKGILIFVVGLAFLMISPIKFQSFKRLRVRAKLFYPVAVATGILLVFFLSRDIPILLLGLLGYVLSSLFFDLYTRVPILLKRK